jgi:hypothetical protein
VNTVGEYDRGVIVPVAIAHLLTLLPLHPYDSPAWDCDPFTVGDVLACTDADTGDYDTWTEVSRSMHIAHIAHLAREWANDGSSVPVLQVYRGVTLCDGWHRLAAAMARGEEFLYVDLSGDLVEALEYGIPFAEGQP